jgi:hypothetical protein
MPEIRNPEEARGLDWDDQHQGDDAAFGLRLSFGFRHSGFGFQAD